jgi:hypothetical protein
VRGHDGAVLHHGARLPRPRPGRSLDHVPRCLDSTAHPRPTGRLASPANLERRGEGVGASSRSIGPSPRGPPRRDLYRPHAGDTAFGTALPVPAARSSLPLLFPQVFFLHLAPPACRFD